MKRLFRKWLKRQVLTAQTMPKQLAFEWIYNSPITTWKDKLYCLRNSCNPKEDYNWLNGNDSSIPTETEQERVEKLLSL